MKVALLGSSGFLGHHIYKELKNKFKIYHTGLIRRKFDLNKINQLTNFIISCNPNFIINCVAIANIDTCEKRRRKSFNVNVKLLKNIFIIKKKFNLQFKLIHFSTDQLYDNKLNKINSEKSKIKINNTYSLHKYLAEKICKKNKAIIFRTNFFGKNKNSFSNWVYKNFKNKKNQKFFLFKDVYFSPLRVNTIAKIIKKIINKKLFSHEGIYNLGSKDGLSKLQFSVSYAKKLRIFCKKKFISSNVNDIVKVKRSKNMRLNVTKFEKYFNIKMNTLNNEIKLEAKQNAKN